jgi:tetratricopeptide (TPR) repeat protein
VDRWEREPTPVPAPRPKKASAKAKPIRAKALPSDVVAEVAAVAPSARRAPMLQKRLGDAARHMQHGRDRDAATLLRALSQEVPEAASVRELYGQVLYSLGRYRQAAAELEAFVELSASTDQHPMLADCYRALGRHRKVQELWAELRESSPAPDIVAEGRIVMAGSLADQGNLDEAIKLLEGAPPVRGRVQDRHLRTWFALADLYERSGELAKARATFRRVRKEDPEFVDVGDRLRALG